IVAGNARQSLPMLRHAGSGAQWNDFPEYRERSQSTHERSTPGLSEDRLVLYFAVPPAGRPEYRSQESASRSRGGQVEEAALLRAWLRASQGPLDLRS